MDDILMYIPNDDDKQNELCRLQLLFENLNTVSLNHPIMI